MKMLHITAPAAMLILSTSVQAAQGFIAMKSPYSVKETADRIEAAAKSSKLNVFLRLDHAAGAKKVGKTLRPTELVIFGNPQGGTPLMECAQTTGIDLPLKALAWEDSAGQVWVGYNDPQFLADRHGGKDCAPIVEKLRQALSGLVKSALK